MYVCVYASLSLSIYIYMHIKQETTNSRSLARSGLNTILDYDVNISCSILLYYSTLCV